ncbi:MAG TPA: YbhB/YbcL family Raf kinase inhibitor-like protein [Kofleriaceae bacterium]|nr:YbhB/YbcL family Raf kinase inhibitor-like protein [Kofleriaceae bacterium]
MRIAAVAIALIACGKAEANVKDVEPKAPGGKAAANTITVKSSAFEANGSIPSEHTCEGADRSPPIAWEGAPAEAKSVALIVDDPDAPDPAAPKRIWVHWVVGGLPVAGAIEAGSLPAGAKVGKNDWGKAAWGGPCPPIGRHRYFFKVYALDAAIDATGLDKAALVKAMDGHVLARGELIGTYQKKK